MQLRMQCSTDKSGLVHSRWDVALLGEAIDDRGKAALEFAKLNSNASSVLTYCSETFMIERDGKHSFAVEQAASELSSTISGASVLVETTTLGFTEILAVCRAAQKADSKLALVYTEPVRYKGPSRRHFLHRRDFELSTDVSNFTAVPGNAVILGGAQRVKGVFLVGYEGNRLGKALDETDLEPTSCAVIFGVPAFRPGWEMDSFANNVQFMEDYRVVNNVYFAGAQNPLAAWRAIRDLHALCDLKNGEKLMIVPIGTKPHAIAAALFASTFQDDVALMYDNPQKMVGRTEKVSNWHLFEVEQYI